MNTLTKLALGLMGQLRPNPPVGDSATSIAMPMQVLLAQTVGYPK